jgi:uncharacterized repeat protein (TIGR02543 family)
LVAGGTLYATGESGAQPTELQILEGLTAEPVEGAPYDGYIVKVDAAAASVDDAAMERVAETTVGDGIALVKKPADALRFADAGDIEAVEPNYKVTALDFPQTAPIDPHYAQQWSLPYINALAAWQAGYRGAGVNIAIMDTGLVSGHEDLNGSKVLEQIDWVNGDYNAEDDNMHGSVVGGIIAADTNNYQLGTLNGVGMAGLSDQSNLIIHKVLDAQGSGDTVNILYALYHVLQDGNRIDVINMSLGHEGYLSIENELIQQIIAKGTIVVAATGNNGADTDGTANYMNYPAGYSNVIGVGSVGSSGVVSSFSTKNDSVDVTAPGELMVGLKSGTTNGYWVKYGYEPGYGQFPMDGTSFASPVVAAAAAMAKQRDKNINAGAFLTALKRSSTPEHGDTGYDISYGYGVLNLAALANYLQTGVLTATFDANGGKVSATKKYVWAGGKFGTLPTPTKSGKGFGGWYTKKTGGTRVTSLSTVGSSSLTLYAHWQLGTTPSNITASAGKLSPAFSYKKTSYKLTLGKSVASTKITVTKSYKSAKVQIKVGSGKYKTRTSATVKLKKGKSTKVYIKFTKKGMKTKTYKITVKRKK